MKMLMLSTTEPDDYSSGGKQRSNHMRDALLRIADVDTIAFTGEGPSWIRSEWDERRVVRVNVDPGAGRWERFRHRLAARRLIARAMKANRYDFVVARYFGRAALVPPHAYRRLVVDADDLRQTDIDRSPIRHAFVAIRAAAIRLATRSMVAVWLVDPRDRVTIPNARVVMLPNTARRLAADPPPRQGGRRILMVGMYPYPPNEEGLLWFARGVLPRLVAAFPDVEFHAVGQYYKQELNELHSALKMRGFVDDLAAEYARADVVVCPIASGSGTQIKAVEALMAGRPTVISDFSYQGFADVLVPDEHLLVAKGEEEWVSRVGDVLHDPDRFAAMAARGREAAERAYSVEAFAEKVVGTFR